MAKAIRYILATTDGTIMGTYTNATDSEVDDRWTAITTANGVFTDDAGATVTARGAERYDDARIRGGVCLGNRDASAADATWGNLGPIVSEALTLPVTRQNVTSTDETDTSVVVVPANTWPDGVTLYLEERLFALNNSGGTITWTRKLYAEATAVTVLSANNVSTNAAVRAFPVAVAVTRVGADLYYESVGSTSGALTSRSLGNTSVTSGTIPSMALLASGVDFTANVTIKLTMELSAYDASAAYYDCVSANATLR